MGNYDEKDETIIDAEAVREEPDSKPEDGRHIASGPSVAPGGGIVPAPARSAGAFVDLLEDGQLSHEMHHELADLAAQMRAVAGVTGGKAKGSLTLTVNLMLEGDAFRIQGSIKKKAPDLPRKLSIMWQDDQGNFTRFPPNQTQMFGTAPIRRVG